jgi:hypothetical protein
MTAVPRGSTDLFLGPHDSHVQLNTEHDFLNKSYTNQKYTVAICYTISAELNCAPPRNHEYIATVSSDRAHPKCSSFLYSAPQSELDAMSRGVGVHRDHPENSFSMISLN